MFPVCAGPHVEFEPVVVPLLEPLPGDGPHRCIVGAELLGRHEHREATLSAERIESLAEERIGRNAPTHSHRAAAGLLDRQRHLGED